MTTTDHQDTPTDSPLAALDREIFALAMRAEANDISTRRPDIVKDTDTDRVPVVILMIPAELTCRDLEVAVHHRPWGEVQVDVREKQHHSWTPLRDVGGDFEERSA